ncbi:MAG: carboxypeptidase-like regulatory domain-containing protein [Bacteroidia bacterium]|nr:carboxypeptidase-like regulatory domain-containing protein [Bacteroidia bacterium]
MKRWFAVLLLPLFTAAQVHTLTGTVTDSENNEPVAFAAVHAEGTKQTVLTDISGQFTLQTGAPVSVLRITHVAYHPITVSLEKNQASIRVKMHPVVHSFDAVNILPGENPAHRIILQVQKNAAFNDPYAQSSFRCETYTKMYVTGEFPADTSEGGADSLKKTRQYFKKQHLFLTETVTEKIYIKPSKENEKVIGSRVSGFQLAPFFTPVSQLQSFGFYSSFITILDKDYVNPLSQGTFKRYFFLLEDTILTTEGDSIFLISFRPRKGRNFEAMKGVLYIHTSGYALYRVIAEPVDETGVISAHIEQEYERTNGKWFPMVLHTDWYYNNMKVGDSSITASTRNFSLGTTNKMKVVCKSRIRRIEIGNDLDDVRFSPDAVFADPEHGRRDSAWWEDKRMEKLDAKDLLTYRKLDSTGNAEHFDRKMDFAEALADGNIPLGPVELELPHLFRYNEVEKVRIGVGLHTSRRLLRLWQLGGYVAYGAKDQRFKYGGRIHWQCRASHEFSIATRYLFDLSEPGKTDWMEPRGKIDGSSVREYKISWLEWKESVRMMMSMRMNQHLKWYAAAEQYSLWPDSGVFAGVNSGAQVRMDGVSALTGTVQLRWQQNEKFIHTRFGRNSLGSKWPVVYLRWSGTVGDPVFDLQLPVTSLVHARWNRYEFRVDWEWKTKTKGTSFFRLEGGKMYGKVPVSIAFIPFGSYAGFGHFAENTFENMRYNEFASTTCLSLFHRHDFGKISRKHSFNPSVVLVNNLHWGLTDNTILPTPGIAPVTPEQVYMESGIQINGLLRNQFIGLGLQGMYRYGYYSFPQVSDNYSIKTTFKILF